MAGAAASHRLRALILSKDFTRRYADALCCDQELEALLSADAATLHSKLACLGVPMLHKAPVAKLVREAQSVCEAAHGQADLKLAADESLSDGEAATEGMYASAPGRRPPSTERRRRRRRLPARAALTRLSAAAQGRPQMRRTTSRSRRRRRALRSRRSG